MRRSVLVIENNRIYMRKLDKEFLKEIIFTLIQLVPPGFVTTYKDIAMVLNISPRLVAKVLSENSKPIVIPCHRVVRCDGGLGGYTLNGKKASEFKKKLLMLENFGSTPSRYSLYRTLMHRDDVSSTNLKQVQQYISKEQFYQ